MKSDKLTCSCFARGKGDESHDETASRKVDLRAEIPNISASRLSNATKKEIPLSIVEQNTLNQSQTRSDAKSPPLDLLTTQRAQKMHDGEGDRGSIPECQEEKVLGQIGRIRLRGRDDTIIRAQELWQEKPVLLLLLRRPGCSETISPHS